MDSQRLSKSGFTLVEALIGTAVSGLVMMAVCSFLLSYSRTSSAIVNYSVINGDDRRSLEVVGRDIREADSFVSLSVTNISMLVNTQVVQLSFAKNERRLYRKSGGTNQVLLPDCGAFQFKFFERDTNAASFEGLKVSTSATCRVVEMNWSSTVVSNRNSLATITNSVRFLNRRMSVQ